MNSKGSPWEHMNSKGSAWEQMQKLTGELTNLAPPPPLENESSDYQPGVWVVEMAGAGFYALRAIYKSHDSAMTDKRTNFMVGFSDNMIKVLKFAITIAGCAK